MWIVNLDIVYHKSSYNIILLFYNGFLLTQLHLGTPKILSPPLIFKPYFEIFWISFMTGPNKVHAFLFVLTEERIIGGNFYWETFWMRNKLTDWSWTILFATLNTSSILIDKKDKIKTWILLLISTLLESLNIGVWAKSWSTNWPEGR